MAYNGEMARRRRAKRPSQVPRHASGPSAARGRRRYVVAGGGLILVLAAVTVWLVVSRPGPQKAEVEAPPAVSTPVPPPERALPTIQELREEELSAARQILAEFPDDPRSVGLAGTIWSKHGDQSKAAECWQRALAMNPTDGLGYEALAQAAFMREDHSEALRLWRKAAALSPQRTGIHQRLGETLLLMGRTSEAAEELAAELRLNPASFRSCFFLGQLALQNKDFEAARGHYEKAIAIRANYAKAHYGLATTLLRLGEKERARRHMEMFQKLKVQQGRIDRTGRSAYDDLQTMQAQVASTLTACGELYAARGNIQRAEELWRRAADLSPLDVRSREHLANLSKRLNQLEEALRRCEELCRIEPTNGLRFLNAGILHARRKDFAAAELAFKTVCTLAPQRSDGPRMLAQIYLDQEKNIPQALKLAQRAVSLEAIAPNYFLLGAIYIKTGDREKGRASLERALALDPQNPTYRHAYESLSRKQ